VKEVTFVALRTEISILKELARATGHSTDRCTLAARVCGDVYRKVVIEQLLEDRRLLLIDLMRCLLLREVPETEVRRAVTEGAFTSLPTVDVDVAWIDVEIAERNLYLALRAALEDPTLSDAVRELLSLHYLRFKLHHDALDGFGNRRQRPDGVEAMVPAGHA
jgi:hypothetical protein